VQGRGIRCWLDEKQKLPGDDIYEQVERGIWLCCSRLVGGRAFAKECERKLLAVIPLNPDGIC